MVGDSQYWDGSDGVLQLDKRQLLVDTNILIQPRGELLIELHVYLSLGNKHRRHHTFASHVKWLGSIRPV